jgi:REP-associated tyrosine transposase
VRASATSLSDYRRDLSHLQRPRKTYFTTFNTHRRWILPEVTRSAVLNHCLHDHMKRYELHAAVVMPDHVHLLFTPMADANGDDFSLAEIMNGIKGSSAHTVNRLLNRRGHVWQSESFDRLLRSSESARSKADYILRNPVRAGLVLRTAGYPWIWPRMA